MLGLYVKYGRVITTERTSYYSGIINRRLYVNYGNYEDNFSTCASFPARSGHAIGVVFGRPSLFGFGRPRGVAVVNCSTRDLYFWNRSWWMGVLAAALWISIVLCEKWAYLCSVGCQGNASFLRNMLPSFHLRTMDVWDIAFWIGVCIGVYPAYKMFIWRRIERYCRDLLKG